MQTGSPIDPQALSLPEKHLSGYAEVLEHLRREMTLGRIRVGDRLPSERKLSEHLGVARETLRQALRMLEGSGHLVIQRGSRGGAVVQSVPVDQAEVLRRVVERQDEIFAVIEFRSVVEAAAAGLAAQRRTTDDVTALENAQADLLAAESLHACRDFDTAFHLAIADASGNREIALAVEDLRVKMFHSVDVIEYDFIRGSSHSAHQRILAAIREGDSERAAQEMRAHLETTREEFEHIIAEHTGHPTR
ncbi:MAG: FCD domain-containing protein [Actinobacteria bacterium]|nr:FCD domain-containing protein [Actinomycetota bacterium]